MSLVSGESSELHMDSASAGERPSFLAWKERELHVMQNFSKLEKGRNESGKEGTVRT